jgi:hypothetical protein
MGFPIPVEVIPMHRMVEQDTPSGRTPQDVIDFGSKIYPIPTMKNSVRIIILERRLNLSVLIMKRIPITTIMSEKFENVLIRKIKDSVNIMLAKTLSTFFMSKL